MPIKYVLNLNPKYFSKSRFFMKAIPIKPYTVIDTTAILTNNYNAFKCKFNNTFYFRIYNFVRSNC